MSALFRILRCVTAWVVLASTAEGAFRTAAAEPTEPSPWTLSLGLGVHADDNVLQLTQRNLDRLDTNPGAPRFLIGSAADQVMDVNAAVSWRFRVLPRRESRWTASADIDRFSKNPVKSWQEYQFSMLQELTGSRRARTSAKLWIAVIPQYYLGEFTDEDDSFQAGRRIRRSMEYSQTSLGARLTQRSWRGRLSAAAGLERVHRDYGSHFDERDNDNQIGQLEVEMQPLPSWDGAIRIGYRAGRLSAHGDLAASPIRDADISYQHRGLGGGISAPWGRGVRRGRAELAWMPERRAYTTADAFDLNRFGRTNHRAQWDLTVSQRVAPALEAVATWSHLTSDARFASGTTFDEDATDFAQTRFGLMLRGRWAPRGR